MSTACSLSGAEASCDDRVEEVSEELEPLALLDLAIAIGVEAVKELLDLGVLCGLVAALGETVASELQNLGPIDLSVAVDVELSESFLGLSKCSSSGSGNLFLVSSGKCHFLSFIFDLSLQF